MRRATEQTAVDAEVESLSFSGDCMSAKECVTACRMRAPRGCLREALFALMGWGTTRDVRHAEALLRADCDAGQAPACESMVSLNVVVDLASQQALLERHRQLSAEGCDRLDGHSCTTLGRILWTGAEQPQDSARAIQLMFKGCHAGDWEGCGDVWLFVSGRASEFPEIRAQLPEVRRRAIESAEAECQRGNPRGCEGVAKIHGIDSPEARPHLARAVELMEVECDRGFPPSCYWLWGRYRQGTGVAIDLERAQARRRRACEMGHQDACFGKVP